MTAAAFVALNWLYLMVALAVPTWGTLLAVVLSSLAVVLYVANADA